MQAETNNHPDIIWVTHEKKSIGVDDIRLQVNSDIFVKPYSSSYKIYIIDEAEKLTEQAQNALLKTIEEPPEYALFLLLVSNIATILPTILSRCIQLNLILVGKEAIMEYLMTNHQIPDYLAEIAANFSGGNVGKALRYASSENFDRMKDDVLHILKNIDDMELHEIITSLKTYQKTKKRSMIILI